MASIETPSLGDDMKRQLAALILLAAATSVSAQWLDLKTPGVPRTADGKPNLTAPAPRSADGHPELTGLWRGAGTKGDLRDATKIQAWARETMSAHEKTYYKEGPHMQCLPIGPGSVTGGGGAGGLRRIVQGPGAIAVLNGDLTYRTIFTDGRKLEADPLPTWMGYSVGHWDKDTLVVESNGYNDKTWLHPEGLVHTDKLRVTERYSRPDFGHMQVEVTYDDPGTFVSPLHVAVALEYAADDEILEYVCNEAPDGGTKHWVGDKISDNAAPKVDLPAQVLSRYVGTYKGYWLDSMTTLVVTLKDGALSVRRNGSKESALIAQSEATFVCPTCQWGQPYIFAREGDGPAPQVKEVQVSGEWIFKRVQ
jgi:hypothetical protein